MIKKYSIKLLTILILLFNSNYYLTFAKEENSNKNYSLKNKDIKFTKDEYKKKTASELSEMVKNKKITSEKLVNLAFEIIKEENPELNAVISIREKEAISEAKKIDENIDNLLDKPFLGVPTLMKGYGHSIKGQPNTLGYKFNDGNIAKNDSSESIKFKNLGFILLGTTNYPEGAMRNITDSKLYGVAKNPWNKNYNTGGSSGGAAAAVSTGMVPIASGSDIGGSIRIPASWNGLIGLKPTSYSGYAVHFPLVKSAKDAEIFFENTFNKKNKLINVENIKNLKIGYSTELSNNIEVSKEAIEATMQTVEFLTDEGFELEKIKYPLDAEFMLAQYTHIAISNYPKLEEILSSKKLTKYDVDPLTWALNIYLKNMNSKERANLRVAAQKKLEEKSKIMETFHKKYPIILTPTTAQAAPLNSDYYVEPLMENILYNFDKVPKEKRYDVLLKQWEPMFKRTPFTLISNLTKEPSITLPTYIGKNNLPMGIMLNAPKGYDKVLLEFAKYFEDNYKLKLHHSIDKKTTMKGNSVFFNLPDKKLTMKKIELNKFSEFKENTIQKQKEIKKQTINKDNIKSTSKEIKILPNTGTNLLKTEYLGLLFIMLVIYIIKNQKD